MGTSARARPARNNENYPTETLSNHAIELDRSLPPRHWADLPDSLYEEFMVRSSSSVTLDAVEAKHHITLYGVYVQQPISAMLSAVLLRGRLFGSCIKLKYKGEAKVRCLRCLFSALRMVATAQQEIRMRSRDLCDHERSNLPLLYSV